MEGKTGASILAGAVATAVVGLVTATNAPWWFDRGRAEPPKPAGTAPVHEPSSPASAPRPQEPEPLGRSFNRELPPAASVDDDREGVPLYVARLGAADHCNSQGARLERAPFVVRQDRANQANTRDAEDQATSRFETKDARRELERRIEIAPEDAATIVTHLPRIAVLEHASGYRVHVLERGPAFERCP